MSKSDYEASRIGKWVAKGVHGAFNILDSMVVEGCHVDAEAVEHLKTCLIRLRDIIILLRVNHLRANGVSNPDHHELGKDL